MPAKAHPTGGRKRPDARRGTARRLDHPRRACHLALERPVASIELPGEHVPTASQQRQAELGDLGDASDRPSNNEVPALALVGIVGQVLGAL